MEPVIELDGVRVFHGDCVEVLKTFPDNSFDAVVTDPPYGLEFMGKDWDAPWKGNGNFAGNVEDSATSAGGALPYSSARVRYHKGQEAMVSFQLWSTEWAVECLRVLKPGGHILAFGGSRTWHRLAVAIEDAGFELRDSIAWIYGSGFPKSLDVSKAIDKKLGADGTTDEVLTMAQGNARKTADGSNAHLTKPMSAHENANKELVDTPIFGYEPATPESKKWQGWGTALKPAFEPIVVARKPLSGTVAETVLEWGTGGLNIDGSRIGATGGTKDSDFIPGTNTAVNAFDASGRSGALMKGTTTPTGQGRWPANVILDEVTAGLLDEQSGVLKSGAVRKQNSPMQENVYEGGYKVNSVNEFSASEGGASRFFYCAKASKRDRNEGLEDLEAVKGGSMNGAEYREGKPTNHPMRQNFHPTVKPTALMRYLVKLVTPPGGTVLDPFTGSGSTGKAAILEGFDFVGVELTDDYLPIIEGRLKWALENKDEGTLF